MTTKNISTKKLFAILIGIIMGSLLLFTLASFFNSDKEHQQVSATQGIKIVGSTTFYESTDSSTPKILKVGDFLLGKNEQIFNVTEIRKSFNNEIFVVVSWKYILDYTSYEDYKSTPYQNYKTYDLKSFIKDKSLISENDIINFYTKVQSSIVAQKQAASQNLTSPPQPPSITLMPSPQARVLSKERKYTQVYNNENASKYEDINGSQTAMAEYSAESSLQEVEIQEEE